MNLYEKPFNTIQPDYIYDAEMRKTVLTLALAAILITTIVAGMQLSGPYPNSKITRLEVNAQTIKPEVIHKEITIMPNGGFAEDYLYKNGTYVYSEHPDVPISRNIFGNYYTLTGDLYGHLVIERDNIVVDGAGHKLQLEGYGSWAISAGIRDLAHSNSEFVGTNNVVITNIIIEDFGYGIELGGSNNVVSKVTLTSGDRGGKAIWDSGSNNNIRECRIFGNTSSGIYVAGTGAVITNNLIANNSEAGIEFSSSAGSLRENTFAKNGRVFDFGTLPSTSNVIDSSNKVDGKPVYCWTNEHNKTAPSGAGYVLLNNCSNITVQGISILNSSEGVVHNSNGIYLYSTRDSLITKNYLQAGAGVRIDSSCQNVTVQENYFGSGSGGLSIKSSSNVSVIANNLQTSGILLSRVAGCLVFNNTFSEWAVGVRLEGAPQNRILQNSVTDCDVGISIFMSDENVFSDNNFVNNQQDVWEQHEGWEWPSARYYESINNVWDGNFWSNYTGKDTNRDGVGDTPHVIYEDKIDTFPLISAVDIPELILEPTNSSSSSEETDGTSVPLILWGNVAAVVTVVAVVVAGLLVYYKKHKHNLVNKV
jgi:parallel beta-helix repeat protein